MFEHRPVKKKKNYRGISPDTSPEYKIAGQISLDVRERASLQHKLPVNITPEDCIKSFQNGLSKGFINGLTIMHKEVEKLNPELARELEGFLERSTNEQFKEIKSP